MAVVDPTLLELLERSCPSQDSDWHTFREATCELQKIDLCSGMDANTKIAFVEGLAHTSAA
eukprot:2573016-Amphidinium_carterae.2